MDVEQAANAGRRPNVLNAVAMGLFRRSQGIDVYAIPDTSVHRRRSESKNVSAAC